MNHRDCECGYVRGLEGGRLSSLGVEDAAQDRHGPLSRREDDIGGQMVVDTHERSHSDAEGQF